MGYQSEQTNKPAQPQQPADKSANKDYSNQSQNPAQKKSDMDAEANKNCGTGKGNC